ncbi:Tn3 family transposase [Streptomyces sp. NPDC060209]|uniref:Tn3 family transposase n=1 Tax=Streptomyces sp. NPDC060209 TaxID=3347073 RepID=UPI00366106EE
MPRHTTPRAAPQPQRCWPAPATPRSVPWRDTPVPESTRSPVTSRNATPPRVAARDARRSRPATAFLPAPRHRRIVRQLLDEGEKVAPEDLAQVSPYLTEHIRRFGEYSTRELADEPDAYDPRLDVDFTPIRGDGPPADGFSGAA